MAEKTVHVFISGRVQGVWYRGWTVSEARSLGLSGWVRNRMDGRVEALFSGDEAVVDDMLNRCEKGPPVANVTRMEIEAADPPLEPGFTQMPTV